MVTQIAVSLLLLVAAGLFVRTLTKLNSVELGFNRENLLLFNVNARQAGYREDDDAVLREPAPAVRGHSRRPQCHRVELSRWCRIGELGGVTVPGYTRQGNASFLSIAPDFFDTMQIPDPARPADRRARHRGGRKGRRRERGLREELLPGAEPDRPAVHSRNAAATARDRDRRRREECALLLSEGGLPAVAYLPYTYDPRSMAALTFELRAAGDPMTLVGAAREIVRQADSRIPVTDIRTQEARHRPDHRAGAHLRNALHRVRAARGRDRVRRAVRHDGL